MDKYEITFKTWNKVAKLYQEKFMNLTLYDDTYDAFCKELLKVNPKVLEIGCGPGNVTKYLLSKRPDFAILGIDVASNMIDLAMQNNPDAIFEVMDVRGIDRLKEEYDGIVCGFCLPYLSREDIFKLIRDSKDLLSENGILYLSFVEGEYSQSGFQYGSSGDKTYFYYHQEENLLSNLKENGFETIGIEYKQYKKSDGTETHTILLAKKLKEQD